jgi:hypothetical protein
MPVTLTVTLARESTVAAALLPPPVAVPRARASTLAVVSNRVVVATAATRELRVDAICVGSTDGGG